MPSFVSQFHLPRRGGTECATWEKVVAEEKKQLHCKKVRKHEACQKRRVLPSDDDDEDNDVDVEDEDEVLAVLDALQ